MSGWGLLGFPLLSLDLVSGYHFDTKTLGVSLGWGFGTGATTEITTRKTIQLACYVIK